MFRTIGNQRQRDVRIFLQQFGNKVNCISNVYRVLESRSKTDKELYQEHSLREFVYELDVYRARCWKEILHSSAGETLNPGAGDVSKPGWMRP